MRHKAMVLCLLMACEEDVETPPADGTQYLAALSAEGLEESTAACLQIQSPALQGDCLLHLAGATARAGEDARDTCRAIAHSRWRQACYFEISDGAGLIDQDAMEACEKAPDFRDRCLSHAIVRHAGRVANRFELGEETEFSQWIVQQADRYGLANSERVVADVLAQHISSRACPDRGTEAPCPDFARQDCGRASDEICRQAYRVTARTGARDIDITAICRRPIEREALRAVGLPVWNPDFSRTAIETWGHICQSMTGQTPPPGGPL
jgi:hypothetical protein